MIDLDLFLKVHDYSKWEVKDPEDYDWNEFIFDDHGYVILRGGIRYDASVAEYKQEREFWNDLKKKLE